ncbi:MAG: hypothetical protein ABI867_02565, partial [Kofleriaceae bacterium]
MYKWIPVALAALATSCDDGPPAGRPTISQDQLWGLAPEGAGGGIVASPHAIGMIEDGVLSLRSFMEKAGLEMDQLEEQIDGVLAPFGGHKATLAEMGLTRTKPGALFIAPDGMVAVLPIADRDAFLAKANGTKSPTVDGIDKIGNASCKLFGPHYVCAQTEALLGKVGKGTLKAEVAKAKSRGDIEIVGTRLPLGGKAKATFVATVQLERGELVMRGLLINPPAESLKWLETSVRPRTQIGRSAGLAVVDPRAMFANTPPVPLVEGVTIVDVVKTFAGPATITIPAGEANLDAEIPLTDPAPATKVLAKCDVTGLKDLGAKLVDGVCRIRIEQATLDLDLWVDGNTLHVGHKGKELGGKSVPMRPLALEVATGQWGFVIWGRGSSFAPQAKTTPNDVTGINPVQAMPLRVMSAVDEIGFAAKKETLPEGDAIRFVLDLRTSFANPATVIDKLVTISAMDILANTASGKAKPIADAHPGTLYAADFTAGQHGLLLPTKLVDIALQVGIPALMRYTRGGAPAEAKPEQTPDAEAP